MLIPSYIRRAAEIEMALLIDYAMIHHRSLQTTIELFNNLATILNVKDNELIKTVVVNYKKLMPTDVELAVISDLASSRSAFIRAAIVKNKLSRKVMYQKRREAGDIQLELSPKCKNIITDALIDFLNKFEPFIKSFSEISLFCYDFEE